MGALFTHDNVENIESDDEERTMHSGSNNLFLKLFFYSLLCLVVANVF